MTHLSSLFEIPLDGWDRDRERFRNFCLCCSLIDSSQHTLPEVW
jgi:hypothetical protein